MKMMMNMMEWDERNLTTLMDLDFNIVKTDRDDLYELDYISSYLIISSK